MIARRTSFALLAALLLVGAVHAQTPAPASGKVELQWFAHLLNQAGGKGDRDRPLAMTDPQDFAGVQGSRQAGQDGHDPVTHAHFDHFGDAVELAKKNNVPVLGTAGLGQTLQVLGILPRRSPYGWASRARSSRSTASRSPRCTPGTIRPPADDPATTRTASIRRPAGRLHHRARERLQDLPHGRHRLV